MRLSHTDLLAVLTVVAGGLIGASLSLGFLGRSRADDVAVFDLPMIVESPSTPSLRVEVLRFEYTGVGARAARLVREQHYIQESMKRLAEAGSGPGSAAGRRLFERKNAMLAEIVDLEREILRLSGEVRLDPSQTSDRFGVAASMIEDDKLKERVRYSRGLIGVQDREYTREFEAETSRIVEELQEELESSRPDALLRPEVGLIRERR